MPLEFYFTRFVHLLVVPFTDLHAAWPILPVYTTLVLGELYRTKVSFGHAVGNGFVMLWAGLNWAQRLARAGWGAYLFSKMAIAWVVTGTALALGVFAIILGLRKKDRALCQILGHTRFSCYFLITLYPMQARVRGMEWEWSSLAAILIFALPCWFLIYLTGRVIRSFVK